MEKIVYEMNGIKNVYYLLHLRIPFLWFKNRNIQPRIHLLSSDILNEKCTIIIQINIKHTQSTMYYSHKENLFFVFIEFSGWLFHIQSSSNNKNNNNNNNQSGNTTWVCCKISWSCADGRHKYVERNRIEMNEKANKKMLEFILHEKRTHIVHSSCVMTKVWLHLNKQFSNSNWMNHLTVDKV